MTATSACRSPPLLSSFQPHMHNRGKAQCMKPSIRTFVRIRLARVRACETLSCVSAYQFGWHITYPTRMMWRRCCRAGTIIHITSWHDNTAAIATTRTRKTGSAEERGRSTR